MVGLCVAQLAFLTPPFLGGTAFSESEIVSMRFCLSIVVKIFIMNSFQLNS